MKFPIITVFSEGRKDFSIFRPPSYSEHYEVGVLAISKRNLRAFCQEATNHKLNGYMRTRVKEAMDEGLIKSDFTSVVTVTDFLVRNRV